MTPVRDQRQHAVTSRVKVDEHGRTNVAGVWALGDVSSDYQLNHVANHEAWVVVHNLAHPNNLRSFDHRFVPQAVFTSPQIASVGLTVLGAHLMGYQASNLIAPLIQGMSFGQTVTEMARGQYWIHPALSEVVENALLGLDLDPQ